MKRILSIFLVIIMLLSLAVPAFAEEGDINNTTVTDDLKNANYDMSQFGKDENNSDVYLVTMREYGYGSSSYNLYFYFYNPSAAEISNFYDIQLADEWDEDGNAIDYEKYKISLCSVSGDNLLLKVKLSSPKEVKFFEENKKRTYWVSGVEMTDVSSDVEGVKDYSIGYAFTFSGSAETLSCVKQDFLTIELNVHQTSYLTGDSAKGENYSNQINSVYFSIPKLVEAQYGNLYAVNFDYYKYRTMPMILTDNHESCLSLKNVGWVKCDDGDYLYSLWNGTSRWFTENEFQEPKTHHYIDIAFGNKLVDNYANVYHYENSAYYDYLPIVFDVDEIADRTDETIRRKVIVSSGEIQEYFSKYNPLSGRDENPVNYSGVTVGFINQYNGDLFRLDYFDNYDKVNKTLSLDDEINLSSFMDSNKNNIKFILEGKWGYVINPEDYDNGIYNLSALEKITFSDVMASGASNKLCVSEDDCLELADYILNENGDASTYLLRYAWSDDYYCSDMSVDGLEGKFLVSEQTVYIDFEIISLSFKSDKGVVTVIPVNAEPTDGFTDIQDTRPNQNLGDNAAEKVKDKLNDLKSLWQDSVPKLLGLGILIIGIIFVAFIIILLSNSIFSSSSPPSSSKDNQQIHIHNYTSRRRSSRGNYRRNRRNYGNNRRR